MPDCFIDAIRWEVFLGDNGSRLLVLAGGCTATLYIFEDFSYAVFFDFPDL